MSAEAPTNAEPAPAELATPAPSGRPLVVLVCGDRHWTDGWLIQRTLGSLGPVGVVLHGGCWGADRLGGWAARQLGIPVEVFPADWEREGKAAGPHRNERMLVQGHPDLVLAFHDDLEHSRGTRDTLVRAVAAGVRTRIVSHACPEETTSLAKAKLLSLAAATPAPAGPATPLAGIPAIEGANRDPPRGTTRLFERRPGFSWRKDGGRTCLEARLVKPLEGFEPGAATRPSKFTLADTTSGLPDDSRASDERQTARTLADLRGRVKAARAAISAAPGAAETLRADWAMAARFYARFGITEVLFRHGVPEAAVAGEAREDALASPADWMHEVRSREAAVLPGFE